MGVHTVCSVLNVEYQRRKESNDPNVKGYSGISIVKQEAQLDEKKVQKLVEKAQGKE